MQDAKAHARTQGNMGNPSCNAGGKLCTAFCCAVRFFCCDACLQESGCVAPPSGEERTRVEKTKKNSATGDSGCVGIAGGIDGNGGIALIAGGGGSLGVVVHGGGGGQAFGGWLIDPAPAPAIDPAPAPAS